MTNDNGPEEILGFSTPGEYDRFCRYLDHQIALGAFREVATEANYQKDQIYGGRWFEHPERQEIWRLVPPDFPFRGRWERVEIRRDN